MAFYIIMQPFRNTLLYLSIIGCLSVFAACNSSTKTAPNSEVTPETPATPTQGPEYTAHYTCPDHCKGSGSDEMGQCPVCGKDYEHNPESDFHRLKTVE